MSTSAPAAPSSGASASAPSSSGASTPSTSSTPSTPSSSTPSGNGTSASSSSTPSPQSVGAPGAQQSSEDTNGRLPGETAQQAAERKFKGKVNGREVEWSEAEVVRRAQLAEAADEKFRKAADIQKNHEAFMEQLARDPFAALEQAGLQVDLDTLAEQRLVAKLQKEMMSPEQRELEELRQYRAQQEESRRAAEQEHTTRQQQAAFAEMQQRAQQQFDVSITQALQSSNLPKDSSTVRDVAGIMLDALSKGYEIDAQTAVDMVRERYSANLQSLVGSLQGEHLVKFLGDDIIKRMRAHDLASLKAKMQQSQPAAATTPPAQPARQPAEGDRKLSPSEWIEEMRRRAGV